MIKTWKQAEKIAGWSKWTLQRRAKELNKPIPYQKTKEKKQGHIFMIYDSFIGWLKEVRLM